MERLFSELEQSLPSLSKIVLSAPAKKDSEHPQKILLQQILSDGKIQFRAETHRENKVFHSSLSEEKVLPFLQKNLKEHAFRQINLFSSENEISFRISKKGKISRSVNQKGGVKSIAVPHNRVKNYQIQEGDRVPFLVDLGVFTKDFKVVRAKYDKFRQINRFAELLDHAFSDYGKDEIKVLDFGCGKSYLTFLIYYYFAVQKKIRVRIIGYDLKKDVVAHCNALAKQYGYHGLSFEVADVTKDRLFSDSIDFVISLHACDVATDFALNFALEHQVPYIFSVPCCQHEINSAIHKSGGELDLFLDHGLFKERLSALLTDAIRTRVLEREGYRVEILEFVDFAHSPKNLMIRAKRKEHPKQMPLEDLLELEKLYGFRQTLLHLRKDQR